MGKNLVRTRSEIARFLIRQGLLPAALCENALFAAHYLATNNLPLASLCLKGSFIICCFILPKLFDNFEALIGCRNPALSVPIGSQCKPLDANNSEHHYGVLGDKLQSF